MRCLRIWASESSRLVGFFFRFFFMMEMDDGKRGEIETKSGKGRMDEYMCRGEEEEEVSGNAAMYINRSVPPAPRLDKTQIIFIVVGFPCGSWVRYLSVSKFLDGNIGYLLEHNTLCMAPAG